MSSKIEDEIESNNDSTKVPYTTRVCTLDGSEHDSTVNVNVNEHDSTVKHGSCGHSGYAGSARPAGGYLISDDLKHLASRAAAACKCSPRRPLRTCALCMQVLTTAP